MAIIRSEFTKIITQRSVWIVAAILLAINLFYQYQAFSLNLETLQTLDENGMHWWYGKPVDAELDFFDTMGAVLFNPGLFFILLGAVIGGAEFRAGQLGLSVLAVPARPRLVIGKTIAAVLFALLSGLVYAALTFIFTYQCVKGWQPGLIWRPEAWIKVAGGVFFMVAITVLTLGVTLVTKRTLYGILIMAGAILITMTQILTLVNPILDAWTPISAARNLLLQSDSGVAGPPFSSSPELGAWVLAVWLLGLFLASIAAVTRRDAR
ncbi:ABC transporter permease [Paenibacillus sp. 598K]|nr:ABC transporter permease [Paenibacillus sp. 598K]